MKKIPEGPQAVPFRTIKKLVARMELQAGKDNRISVDDIDVPPWQRQLVWTADEMGLLALSILRNYPMGMVILWTKPGGVRVPIDGRQRLTAIKTFRDGLAAIPDMPGVPDEYRRKKYRLLPLDDPMKYSELSLDEREAFDDYDPLIVAYDNIDEQTAMDIFIRLQGGKSLTKTEVRAALGGKLCEFVTGLTSAGGEKQEQDAEEDESVSHHKFFQQVNVRNVRKAHRNLCDVLLHEYLYPGKNKHWASLDALYRDKSQTLSEADQRGFKKSLERFRKACLISVDGKEVLLPQLRSAFLILSFYRAWAEIEAQYSKPDGYSFAAALAAFETQRETHKARVPWVNFTAALSNAGYSEGRINERHQILMSFLLREHPTMTRKDKNRVFSVAQKLAMWDRASHRCEWSDDDGSRCEAMFPDFQKADADHFMRWSDGGETSLENGRLLCAVHNRGRGRKEGTGAAPQQAAAASV